MAVIETPKVEPMTAWELYWASRGKAGILHIWAPDGDTAIETVRSNLASFGLDEHALVGHATGIRLGGSLRGRVLTP